MTISEVSKKYDISTDTLRYYERIGLLPPVPRTKSGLRDYDENSCKSVEFIKCMRNAADRHNEFTSKVAAELKKRGIRVEVDGRSEKIGFKIREAQLQKIPYMLVIGDKEVETENVSIRCRKRGDIGTMSVSDFCDMVEKEIREKTIITD